MSVIPSVWQGYSKEGLAEGIREMKKKNKDSFIARLRHKGFYVFCLFYFRTEWELIADELEKCKSIRGSN